MYGYEWTKEYGIFRLSVAAKLSKEIRPVFREELDFFGMDEYWDYPKDTGAPLLWAEGIRRYVMNGVPVAEAKGGGFYTKPVVERLTEERLTLRPVDVKRLYDVNRDLMLSLEQKAVQFIRKQYERYKKEGYAFVCAFSGGKDSLVLLDLCAKALAPGEFYVIFSNTGMELSDTLKAVERAKERYPELRFAEAKCHMDPQETWEEFGPPANRLRWCCSVHKSVPTILLLEQLVGENARAVVYDGVRREESTRRAKYAEVSEGVKSALQVNCHSILDWSSSEIHTYLLANNLFLNDAYRHGIYRVGCMVCPLSSRWQDAIISHNYGKEVKDFISVIEQMTLFAKGTLDKSYVEDGNWQARVGGKIIPQGENRVKEIIEDDNITFIISKSKQNLVEVLKIFGNIVEESSEKKIIKNKHCMNEARISTNDSFQSITLTSFSMLDRFDISALRAIANKVAYCIGCKSCIPQCPTGAFQIVNGKIQIRERHCVHCYNCCSFTDKGCMVAKSLHIRSDKVKNPDRYRNFGLRQNFFSHLVENGLDCFKMTTLGKDQYKSLRFWMGDAGIFKKRNKWKRTNLLGIYPIG